MSIRFYVDAPLAAHTEMALPAAAARHAQVRRVQPGDALVLFDGAGSDWPATVLAMGRSEVRVRVGAAQPVHNELPFAITLALGMPANERMDAVVEKATELGVAGLQPLHTERSVLRLHGERAQRKRLHWQGVAQAASEQSGRARLPQLAGVMALPDWLAQGRPAAAGASPTALRWVLSLRADALPLASMSPTLAAAAAAAAASSSAQAPAEPLSVVFLSGPEGGLSDGEEDSARRCGFVPVSLGSRVLRADTAPIAALAALGCLGLQNWAPHRYPKTG